MKKKRFQKLTLDQPATYLIKVPGALDGEWLDWNGGLAVNIESEGNDPITTLTITADQAALHGLLKHLYAFGIPLISVVCQDYMINEEA
ncbi:MAG: hypothetical protein PVI99_02845 [Anaerolineales bacterium]|jgi:hypothetical protein